MANNPRPSADRPKNTRRASAAEDSFEDWLNEPEGESAPREMPERVSEGRPAPRRNVAAPYTPIESTGSHARARRRDAENSVSIPRATPAEYAGANYGATIPASPLGTPRGMIPATGYKRKASTATKIMRVIGVLFILALLAVVVGLGVLTITEYNPAATEEVPITHQASGVVEDGQQISFVTWNLGYCGLSDEADFFMDGGKGVRTVNEDGVYSNLSGIENVLREQEADVMFLQELDVDSQRSYHVDESQNISNAFDKDGYSSAFATNYMVAYVPYPIPPLGQVYAGIQTEAKFAADTATRIQLPCPFDWPVRIANLKRCLLVERIPIADTGKELVLVNLHLEAYDDGEGKEEQTQELVRFMAREYERGNYVIAGGDFNQAFSNVDTSAYPVQGDDLWQCGLIDDSAFGENWQLLMDPSVPTCRSLDRPYDANDSSFQYYMIDGYICSPNVLVNELATIDTGFDFSDHNPVRMTVTLSDEETVAADIAAKAEAAAAAAGEDAEEEEAEPAAEEEPEPEEDPHVDEDMDGFDDNTNEWIGWKDENGNYTDVYPG